MHHRLSCLCTGIYSVGWSLGVLLQTLVLLLVLLHHDHHYFILRLLVHFGDSMLFVASSFLHPKTMRRWWYAPFPWASTCRILNMWLRVRNQCFWKNRCRLRQRNPFILYNVMYLHIFQLKKQGIVVKSSNHLTFLQPWLVPSFPFGTTWEGYYLQHCGAGLQGRSLNFGCRKRRFHGDKNTDNLMSCPWHHDTPKNSLMV